MSIVIVLSSLGIILSVFLNLMVVLVYLRKGSDITYKDLILLSMAVTDVLQVRHFHCVKFI